MGKVSALFIRKITNVAVDSVDKNAFLRTVGIELDSPIDSTHKITDTEYYALLERLAVLDPHATTNPIISNHQPKRR